MFANRVAVVTGASSGIGRALAEQLAQLGACVGLVARRREQLEALAASIRNRGGQVEVAMADVSERASTLQAIHDLTRALGPIDLLIANAGLGKPTRVDPLNSSDIEEVMRVNLLGVVYSIEAVLPAMLERSSGHIAAVSSLAAYKGLPGQSAYCASKSAVNAFMEGLRIQLRSRGIRVTTICPGFVTTPMTAGNRFKMPWLMEPDEAARRILKALAAGRKVFNFPWQMNLLMRVTRWLPDWLMARGMAGQDREQPGS